MTPADGNAQPASRLGRRVGLPGATVIALAAMLGAGVFAAWGPAYSYTHRWLLAALALAAVIASLNAWSTTTLARQHPVAGGAYAYGRRWLGRPWGVAAGLAFLIGKTASAAGAALTFGAYVWPGHGRIVGVVAVVIVLAIDLSGLQRTVKVLAAFVAAIVLSLLPFLVGSYASLPSLVSHSADVNLASVLAGVAILFVAFAGYARVSTMGEEVRDPKRTIPGATIIGLIVVTLLLAAVGVVVYIVAPHLGGQLRADALVEISSYLHLSFASTALRVGAAVASVSVLLSLIVGLGRTLFAMSADGDGIRALAVVDEGRGVPQRAEVVAAAVVLFLTLVGTLRFAYALSGGAVLFYYGIAHLSALRLRRADGGPPRLVPIVGLCGVTVVVVGLLVAQFTSK